MNARERTLTLIRSSTIRDASLDTDGTEAAKWVGGQGLEAKFRFNLHINPGSGEQPHVILSVRQTGKGLRCSAEFHPRSLTDGFSWSSSDRGAVRRAWKDLLRLWKQIEA